jgi:hypothetical protein
MKFWWRGEARAGQAGSTNPVRCVERDVKCRYPLYTSCSVPGLHIGVGSGGGVLSVGTAARVGEGAVFTGAVMANLVFTDEVLTD